MASKRIEVSGNVDHIVAALEAMNLGRFVHVTKTLDKEAMLKEPAVAAGISGISIEQREIFYIETDGVKLSVADGVATRK